MEAKCLEKRINKGDIYYANMNETVGSEQSGVRPVIVVQNDIGNKYSQTVIIVPMTSQIDSKMNQPTHYYLKAFGNIRFNSIVLTEQIRAIDKQRLIEKIGNINYKIMQEIDEKIMIALGMKKFEKVE